MDGIYLPLKSVSIIVDLATTLQAIASELYIHLE